MSHTKKILIVAENQPWMKLEIPPPLTLGKFLKSLSNYFVAKEARGPSPRTPVVIWGFVVKGRKR